MRGILGLLIGLYLTCALVVLGGGVYGFMTHQTTLHGNCTPTAMPGSGASGPSWVAFVLMRAAIWPKAYYDDMKKTGDLMDWVVVKYNAFPACG